MKFKKQKSSDVHIIYIFLTDEVSLSMFGFCYLPRQRFIKCPK